MVFEWDEKKAKINFGKHKVSFNEAETVFEDSLFKAFADPDHSLEENRFVIMVWVNLIGGDF